MNITFLFVTVMKLTISGTFGTIQIKCHSCSSASLLQWQILLSAIAIEPLSIAIRSNPRFYFWPTNIRIFNYWLQRDTLDSPLVWLILEANSSKPTSLKALAHSPILSSMTPYTSGHQPF